MITCRPATLNDLPILYEFEQGIIEYERPFDPTLLPGHFHYYDLRKMIESEKAEVLVATLSSEVVGAGHVRIKKAKHYLQFETYAYLGFMFVKPEHRGKGINKSIVDGLIDWAKQKGFNEVRLDVYAENGAAIRAYEKAGFSKNLIEMRMGI